MTRQHRILGLLILATGGLLRDSSAQEALAARVSAILVRADAGTLEGTWDLSFEIGELQGSKDALAEAIRAAAQQLGVTEAVLQAALGLP